ncbi:hypothetical protein DXG01_013703 [Tephrocybe rancida]|nr:hypothetical protein DXG01_013703 [Tephrocybe rancida]
MDLSALAEFFSDSDGKNDAGSNSAFDISQTSPAPVPLAYACDPEITIPEAHPFIFQPLTCGNCGAATTPILMNFESWRWPAESAFFEDGDINVPEITVSHFDDIPGANSVSNMFPATFDGVWSSVPPSPIQNDQNTGNPLDNIALLQTFIDQQKQLLCQQGAMTSQVRDFGQGQWLNYRLNINASASPSPTELCFPALDAAIPQPEEAAVFQDLDTLNQHHTGCASVHRPSMSYSDSLAPSDTGGLQDTCESPVSHNLSPAPHSTDTITDALEGLDIWRGPESVVHPGDFGVDAGLAVEWDRTVTSGVDADGIGSEFWEALAYPST